MVRDHGSRSRRSGVSEPKSAAVRATGAAGRRAARTSTASLVLDAAERLVQVRGFNGFSYADIAAELQITKASLHYHFATKAELGAYARLYADVLSQQRMCLCGMLAAEYPTLPGPMQSAVLEFFDHNEAWLQAVLEQGRSEGSLEFTGPARDTARMIISGLEGAMLVTRPYGDAGRFRVAADSLLASLTAPAGPPDPADRLGPPSG